MVYCNLVNNTYWYDSKVLHAFIPNRSFAKLLKILLTSLAFLKRFNSEFSYIEVWFTNQNSKPLRAEDKINLTLVNWYMYNNTIRYSVKSRH